MIEDNTKLKKILDLVRILYWRVTQWFTDRWYFYVKNRPNIIKVPMKVTPWMDKDHLMLLVNMKLLVDYVEEERPFELINWDHDVVNANARKEIEEIYKWWKNYENRQKEIDNVLHEWYLSTQLQSDNQEAVKKEKELFDKQSLMETKLDEEEQDMLIRLIKIRRFLWT